MNDAEVLYMLAKQFGESTTPKEREDAVNNIKVWVDEMNQVAKQLGRW